VSPRSLTRREKALLALLGVGLIAVLVVLRRDALLGGRAGMAPLAPGPEGEPPVVRTDLLAREVVSFDEGGRNLFDYYEPPPPPPPPAPPPPPPPPPPRVERPAPPPPVRTGPVEPTPPFPGFTYLGYLGPKDDRIAVFEGEAEQGLMLARVGDVVAAEFRLLEFRFDSVVFGYTNQQFRGRTAELNLSAN